MNRIQKRNEVYDALSEIMTPSYRKFKPDNWNHEENQTDKDKISEILSVFEYVGKNWECLNITIQDCGYKEIHITTPDKKIAKVNIYIYTNGIIKIIPVEVMKEIDTETITKIQKEQFNKMAKKEKFNLTKKFLEGVFEKFNNQIDYWETKIDK